jgi:hypothetical protein
MEYIFCLQVSMHLKFPPVFHPPAGPKCCNKGSAGCSISIRDVANSDLWGWRLAGFREAAAVGHVGGGRFRGTLLLVIWGWFIIIIWDIYTKFDRVGA